MDISILKIKAAEIRKEILSTALNSGKGHVPPAFSWVEIAVALFYGGILNLEPYQPKWHGRDRFILSKGHGCLTLYVVLADLGFFPKEELSSFCNQGSMLSGHPDLLIPGIETITGSLGHGLGIGAGIALSGKLDNSDWLVYVVMGDGECNEGSVWEAAMFANHHKLNNLIAILDRNNLSATDYTENILTLEPLAVKWQAFGWNVYEVDGHSFVELSEVLNKAKQRLPEKPTIIIANTVKGKGVSFMQSSPLWHHRLPKGKEVDQAFSEIGKVFKATNKSS